MNIIINPGSGAVEDCGYEQAYENMMAFIKDTNNQIEIYQSNHHPESDGRYLFIVKDVLTGEKHEIEMPSLPFENVRYLEDEKRSIYEFPRLYVDGSSWIWFIATSFWDDKHRVEQFEEQISDLKDEIEILNKRISDIKNKN